VNPIKDIKDLQRICSQVRRDIIRMTHAVQSGHPGGSLGCTEFFVAMYFNILRHNPGKFSMDGIGEDVFFLSNGHISPVWYSVLSRSGYFKTDELSTFRKINSRLQGHPATHEGLPGVRVASGSLGQGLSVAVGAALAKKLNHDDKFVYCLCGDGEVEEGQIWEAVMYAGAKKVDNIIVTVDVNNAQIDGKVDDVMPYGDLKPKFQSFGWNVLTMNGNNITEVLETIAKAQALAGKQQPVVILMKTEMGHGVDFMVNSYKWHGVATNDEQTQKALAQLEETLGDY
jgi:transketolase